MIDDEPAWIEDAETWRLRVERVAIAIMVQMRHDIGRRAVWEEEREATREAFRAAARAALIAAKG